jgi:hypothetical protein
MHRGWSSLFSVHPNVFRSNPVTVQYCKQPFDCKIAGPVCPDARNSNRPLKVSSITVERPSSNCQWIVSSAELLTQVPFACMK